MEANLEVGGETKRKASMHLGMAYCDHCKDVIEDTLHVLRDFPLAMVWCGSIF